jgi:hypothetical protein
MVANTINMPMKGYVVITNGMINAYNSASTIIVMMIPR